MKVTLDISEEKFLLIENMAKELGLNPTDLMQALLSDQVLANTEDFAEAANRVLQKNKDLYDRLA